MSLCVIAAGKTVTLAVGAFTLAWTHSVEKTEWRESWTVSPAGLELVEARVKGSGAGMDPGEGAKLRDGWWVWSPRLPAQGELHLAASGATVSPWRLCHSGACLDLGSAPGEPVTLKPC